MIRWFLFALLAAAFIGGCQGGSGSGDEGGLKNSIESASNTSEEAKAEEFKPSPDSVVGGRPGGGEGK